MSHQSQIRVVGARQHNLRGIDVTIPRGRFTVVTGVSGSGKSSLAFDTIYAEGQRKYVESLSAYARQFLEQMQKPDVERIEGLSPTIAIEQRLGSAGPRSTVATSTELHDFFRVLFARVGEPVCWLCGRAIVRQSISEIVDGVMRHPEGARLMLLAPLVQEQRGKHDAVLRRLRKEGFVRARVDGEVTLLEELDALPPQKKHTIEVVVDRLIVKPGIEQRLADSTETSAHLSGGRVIASLERDGLWRDEVYSTQLACPLHAEAKIDALSPQLFSFNSPQGACESCHGLGTTTEFDTELIVPDPNASLAEGAIAAWRRQGRSLSAVYADMIRQFCERFGVLPDIPFRNIAADKSRILWHGTTEADAAQFGAAFEGVLPNLRRRWQTSESDAAKQRLHAFMAESPCDACGGARLNRRALCVRIAGRSIADVARLTITRAAAFFDELRFEKERAVIAEPILRGIRERLHFLDSVGVEYLTLDRASATLSGGEFQRIRLATQIGSGLAGVCYVLDEPTIGLHTRDTKRLTDILARLATIGNTVIVVEHDEDVILAADHVVDIGPGAGERGGNLVVQGSIDEVRSCEASITGRFLSGRSTIIVPEKRRAADARRVVRVEGASANNLKNIDVSVPLGCLVCVTGVSGSGKSTLVEQVLQRALKRSIDRSGPKPGAFRRLVGDELIDRVIEIDQAPIGRTPRSNPATYVGVFDLIRKLFVQTREAKIRGYGPTRFSFNAKGGRCEHCEGQGTKRVAMHFLPDVFVECSACGGTRYNRETLEVRYRGKNIADVLQFSVEESVRFFENFANIKRRLQALKDVGLGYMKLGQPSNTLSGGEAQRVKLAGELHKSGDGHTMYILDEPTTGLHPADVRNLLLLVNRLVDRGHTVLVIEHNLDVIKVADWIIDLGPEGGDEGGRIVVEGTPENVAQCREGYTGTFLAKRLKPITHQATER